MNSFTIMLADKRKKLLSQLNGIFREQEVVVSRVTRMSSALRHFEKNMVDVMIVTGELFAETRKESEEIIRTISSKSPSTQIIILATKDLIRHAMSALKFGSYQYARLPVEDEELRLLIETAVEKKPQYGDSLLFKQSDDVCFEGMYGASVQMQEIFSHIRQAASSDIPVLIMGETGTGKDMVAKAIHQQSHRSEGPYVAVNLGALPSELIASELFGHVKGAFTGALESRQGKFEEGHEGTVFLDEISTIDEKVQISLLRLIEQKRFQRLGGRRTVSSNARIIVATNENLLDLVDHGVFREDLYYRLDVFHIVLPPLRVRREDIRLLSNVFLSQFASAFHKNILEISEACFECLELYNWPGNIRELKNVIQRAVLVCREEVLRPENLPSRFRNRPDVSGGTFTVRIGTELREIEKKVIERTLESENQNRKKTAEVLGISRRALYNKIKRYGI